MDRRNCRKFCEPDEVWKKCYKRNALKYHPDKGGDAEIFIELSNCNDMMEMEEALAANASFLDALSESEWESEWESDLESESTENVYVSPNAKSPPINVRGRNTKAHKPRHSISYETKMGGLLSKLTMQGRAAKSRSTSRNRHASLLESIEARRAIARERERERERRAEVERVAQMAIARERERERLRRAEVEREAQMADLLHEQNAQVSQGCCGWTRAFK